MKFPFSIPSFPTISSNLTTNTNRAYKFIKDNTLIVTVVSVSIIVCIILSFRIFKLREGITNQPDDPKGAPEKNAAVLLFSADWCPHCKKAKPEWDAFQSQLPEQLNGYKVQKYSVDCTDDTNPTSKNLMDKFEVTGFPTVLIIKDLMEKSLEGISSSQSNYNVFHLEASPKTDNLMAFANKTII